MNNNKSNSLFESKQVKDAECSLCKAKPKIMFKNPVMFTVEIRTAIMPCVSFYLAPIKVVLLIIS
jgi:K+-transporting ATPase ATPase B chain